MAIFDLYSKRNKIKNESDIFFYDKIPQTLRIQIFYIINDTFKKHPFGEDFSDHYKNDIFKMILNQINREYGLYINTIQDIIKLYHEIKETENITEIKTGLDFLIDFIELTFQFINKMDKVFSSQSTSTDNSEKNINNILFNQINNQIPPLIKQAIENLNIRFKENKSGYRFESDKIIKINSDYTHFEIMIPVLKLLNNNLYQGANDEFLNAHEHYRFGRNKECLNDCLKSFESVMKSICEKRNWKYDKKKDTSNKLIEICFSHKLIPDYLQSQFTSLKSLIESGIPTIRNRTSGHGQGNKIINVDDYIAGYALNLTATNILLLINAENALK